LVAKSSSSLRDPRDGVPFDPHIPASERNRTASAALILLLMLAGHTVLETARDAFFLARLSARDLPLTYGAIAVAALLAAEVNGRLRARLAPGPLLWFTLFIGAVGALLFSIPFRCHAAWAPSAFYVFLAVIATLATSQFWLLVSELFTVLEAKRAFAKISGGGLLGALLGAGLARAASARFGDQALLWVGAGLLLVAGMTAGWSRGFSMEGPQQPAEEPPPLAAAAGQDALREPRSLRYLRRLLLLGLLSTVSATLIDYVFKVQVAASVPKAELSSFFATFNAALNGGALLAQILIAPLLLRQTGVGPALMFVPSLLALLGASVIAVPSLISVLLLRGSDGGLRYSLHRSSIEVLYLPLAKPVRARWKTLVDLIGQRGGQALASIAILGFISAELSVRQMAAIGVLISLAWLALAVTMEPRYIALFRARVRAGAIETRVEVPALDLRSLETLVASLGNDDDDVVLATIALLEDYDRAHMIPALLLYHPSKEIVLRTLAVFERAGRHDFNAAARRLLERDDDEVRSAAMLALAGRMTPAELEAELTKAKPEQGAVRAAVLVALAARAAESARAHEAAREVRAGCEPDADPCTRLMFARALRLSAAGQLATELLPRLLIKADTELECEVARAMLAAPVMAYVPNLLQMLDSRAARSLARSALVALGEPALLELRAALRDPSLSRRLRAHIPRSISRFGTPAATDMLLELLEHEEDGWVRFKVIRGLGMLRTHLVNSRRRLRRVDAAVRGNLKQAVHFMSFRLDLERAQAQDAELATPVGKLLVAALQDKHTHAVDRAVRLAGLRHAADVIHSIRQTLVGSDARLRADSSELLVHRAPQDIALALTTLLAQGDDELRLARATAALSEPLGRRSYVEQLDALLDDSSESVRAIAAFHVRELGSMFETQPALREERGRIGRELRALAANAAQLLEAPAALQARVRRT
jgi:ATP:ADP antiporter, AAA family